jgi:hypothetical protein
MIDTRAYQLRRLVIACSLMFALSGRARAQPTAPPAPPPAPPAAPSSFHVSGYGLIVTNAAYVLGGVNNLDNPQWAAAGKDEFSFSARQSRFGLKGTWLKPPSALRATEIGAQVEADFYGGFLGQGLAYYFPVPRLRIAKAYVEWKWARFTFGQDWALLAPLNPDSQLHVAVPGFAASGNLWARMPQLRVDGVIGKRWRVLWAAALVAEVQNDAVATADNAFTGVRKPEGGENALTPAGEARLAVAHDLFDRAIEVGLSGHLGKRSVAFVSGTVPKINGAVALDANVPIGRMLTLKGEVYYGTGLDSFFGGIQQGISFTRDAMGNINVVGPSIRDVGGWAQLTFAPLRWLSLLAGGGGDAPSRGDFLFANAAANRTLNGAFYGAAQVEVARGFGIGLEYDYLVTRYQAAPTRKTNVIALSGTLAF